MLLINDPAWHVYKAALDGLAEASCHVAAAQVSNAAELKRAERTYQTAMAAYRAARQRLAGAMAEQEAGVTTPGPGAMQLDGQVVQMAALGANQLDINSGRDPNVTGWSIRAR